MSIILMRTQKSFYKKYWLCFLLFLLVVVDIVTVSSSSFYSNATIPVLYPSKWLS